jgi:hypothetical protein
MVFALGMRIGRTDIDALTRMRMTADGVLSKETHLPTTAVFRPTGVANADGSRFAPTNTALNPGRGFRSAWIGGRLTLTKSPDIAPHIRDG